MKSLSTALDDRELRFDGISIVQVEELERLLLHGVDPSFLTVRETNDEVDRFNELVIDEDKISLETNKPVSLSFEWKLPSLYANLNIEDKIVQAFSARTGLLKKYSNQQIQLAANRLEAEFVEIQRRGMTDFFRTIIYVLDEFKAKNIVWGVGRGSSCASYSLFILGLHSVDCIKYGVEMTEFFHS